MFKEIALDIASRGGRAYFVGGYVRDRVMNSEYADWKDIDIEVYGLNQEQILEALSVWGKPVLVGKSFPVIKLSGRPQWDFTLPSHPEMKSAEACGRRDFTINALIMDILTGELIDPLGGKEDIRRGLIRHTHPRVFRDDPLRVYRAAQLAARFQFPIHDETLELMRSADLEGLNGERVYLELRKLLLLAAHPSQGLRYLEQTGVICRCHPLLRDLQGCPQSRSHHPEGDVWEHTLLVVDGAARLKEHSHFPEALMWAALLHDIGKPLVSRVEGEKVTAYGHDVQGEKLARSFLRALTGNRDLLRQVGVLVREHMNPVLLFKQRERVSDRAIRRLVQRVNVSELLLLSEADYLGRTLERDYAPIRDWLLERIAAVGLKPDEGVKPLVTGKDLAELGCPPGKQYRALLSKALDLQMEGKNRGEILHELGKNLS